MILLFSSSPGIQLSAVLSVITLLFFPSKHSVAEGIAVRLWPQRLSAALASEVHIHCDFAPQPAYIIWSYSSLGLEWRKLALCHPSSGKCSIDGNIASANWTLDAHVNGTLRIGKLSPAQDGFYQCEGIHDLEAAKANTTVTVLTPPEPPILSGSPSVLREGLFQAFNCTCSGGNPPPNIDWFIRRSGDPGFLKLNSAKQLSSPKPFGTVSSMMNLSISALDDGALLKCQASNTLKINVSSSFTILRVLYKPRIQPLVSHRVISGDSITLECSARSNPQATLHFMQNGEQLSEPKSADTIQLPVPSISKSLMGNVTCFARNSLGSAEDVLYVDVLYEPLIAIPSSITAREKAELKISCNVDSNPPPYKVSWSHLEAGSVKTNSSVLFLPSAERSDAGSWICLAFNTMRPSRGETREGKSQRSTVVTVEYLPSLPTISSSMGRFTVGSNVTLVCEANILSPGVPAPSFSWTKAGSFGFNKLGAFLLLNSIRLEDDGVYFCTPSNSVGRGPPAAITIVVEQAPEWVTPHPRSPLAIPITRKDFSIECKARAKPKAHITWFKNHKELDLEKYTVKNEYIEAQHEVSSSLFFYGSSRTELSEDDIGLYMCSAQNTYGKILSSVQLDVKFSPRILPVPDKVALRDSPSLECPMIGVPEPDVHWTIDGVPISGNFVRDSMKAYLYRASLVGVTKLGIYVCHAQNSEGRASHSFQVVSPSVPERPEELKVDSQGWNFILLRWKPGFDGGYPTNHWVRYSGYDMNSGDEISIKTRLCDSSSSSNITDLFPNTNYTFQIFAINSLGQGQSSQPVNVVTDHLPIPPITILKREENSLFFVAESNYCVLVSLSKDAGASWGIFHRCIPSEKGVITNIDLSYQYRLALCLRDRTSICGPPVTTTSMSGFPEVSTPTIIIVASLCGALILVLIAILIYFCCRRRSPAKDYADSSSPNRRLQPDITTSTYKSYHQKPYAMVSPHPSLTSTEETVVDQNKVFTTLLSANHPLNGSANFEGSDHSGTLFLNSNRPKKVIYEVVV